MSDEPDKRYARAWMPAVAIWLLVVHQCVEMHTRDKLESRVTALEQQLTPR